MQKHQYKYKLKNGSMWLGFTGLLSDDEFEMIDKNPSFIYEKESNTKGSNMNVQEVVREVNEKRIEHAMKIIEMNPRLSMHHYSNELDIPVSELQNAWAKYSNKKRVKNANV